VFGGIGERLDDLQLLYDRAGPAVRDDQWQRALMRRPDVDEVNIDAVDFWRAADGVRSSSGAAGSPRGLLL
jgi:hypothetical protein